MAIEGAVYRTSSRRRHREGEKPAWLAKREAAERAYRAAAKIRDPQMRRYARQQAIEWMQDARALMPKPRAGDPAEVA